MYIMLGVFFIFGALLGRLLLWGCLKFKPVSKFLIRRAKKIINQRFDHFLVEIKKKIPIAGFIQGDLEASIKWKAMQEVNYAFAEFDRAFAFLSYVLGGIFGLLYYALCILYTFH
ncbi:MAG: hypothetical protein Tsb0021_03590 [Chlamydiales bacterium]